MPVRFEGKNGIEELIPAPLVDVQKQFVRGPDGSLNRVEYTFTLHGTIVNVDTPLDSPGSQGGIGMEAILAEQKRIRTLFQTEGGRLEIEAPDGGGPSTIDAYCTVDSISFDRGVWVNRSEYTIILRSTAIENDGDPRSELESSSENWSITENEDGTFTISHQIQAQGKLIYTSAGPNDPLESARLWVSSRRYTSSTTGSFVSSAIDTLDFADLLSPTLPSSDGNNYWNRSVVESVDPEGYNWSLTESFVYDPNGSASEQWSASVTHDQENLNRVTVNLTGTIIGNADMASNSALRLTNAKTLLAGTVEPNVSSRLTPYIPVGFTINPIPSTKQITYEPNGTIRYTYTFTAGSDAGSLIPGSVEENVSIGDVGTTDIFAQIPVPGRAAGPIVQNMKTITLPERTVSINARMAPTGVALTSASLLTAYLAKPDTNALIEALKPSAGYFYIKQDSEEWSPVNRQYSRTVSWTLQPEGATIAGIPKSSNNASPN